MNELIGRLLPILILLFIGYVAKKKELFSNSFVQGLKVLIVSIALPAVLFDSFSTMTLQISYLMLFLLIFLYCVALYSIGFLLHRFFPKVFQHVFTKGFMTGFEFGMIGVGLFSAIWGIENLWVIMLVGFGHELFIWFFYVLLISKSPEKTLNVWTTLKHFLKTPTILAIILGILANVSGLRNLMDGNLIGQSILRVLEFLKPITSPLILIVIGYTMVLEFAYLKESLVYSFTRLFIVLALGILLLFIIHQLVPGLDPLFDTAFYAFILLPAPYILPVYIQDKKEEAFFTQALLYSTIISFVSYGVLLWIF